MKSDDNYLQLKMLLKTVTTPPPRPVDWEELEYVQSYGKTKKGLVHRYSARI